jgi:hypothetical protein
MDMNSLDERIMELKDTISHGLIEDGYFTTNFLTDQETRAMRLQSIALNEEGRFEQSWSESIGSDGVARRFDKEGVFACEPDGADYESMSSVLFCYRVRG